MSRIDRALRRAAGLGVASEEQDRVTLKEYPRERPPLDNVVDVTVIPDLVADERFADRPLAPPQLSEAPAVGAAAAEELPRLAFLRPASPLSSVLARGAVSAASVVEHTTVAAADPGLTPQCRRLAAMLYARHADGLKTILITSTGNDDQQARTAVGLAQALVAAGGKRLLLIDAGSGQPFVHEVFGIINRNGFGDILSGHGEGPSLVQLSPQLDVIPVGPSVTIGDPLNYPTMRALLEEAAGRYDWVLVNGPSMAARAEVRPLGSLTQGVVLVIGDATPFPVVDGAMTEIGPQRLLGTVLMGVAGRMLGRQH